MANALAIKLDRLGAAEMSCIAGLGGDVSSLVRLARSGRAVLALDGRPLVCVEATLRRHDIAPDGHLVLRRHGVRKRRHADYDEVEAERLLPLVVEAAAALTASDGAAAGRYAPASPLPPMARRGRHDGTCGRIDRGTWCPAAQVSDPRPW
jgi:uncharacterized metal-binding protein